MITIQVGNHKEILKPTIFPDGTSQVWHLSKEIMAAKTWSIIWHFENEAELFHILSLRELKPSTYCRLYMPYLPYARQDKPVHNEATFNLQTFSKVINSMNFEYVSAADVHNISVTQSMINNFHDVSVHSIHEKLINDLNPTYLVFPDTGARNRYLIKHDRKIIFEKTRNQETGEITGIKVSPQLSFCPDYNAHFDDGQSFLIVDDICDGGATFIGIANFLKTFPFAMPISLFVTHGIFSKGRGVLEEAGIKVITTNSLLKNADGIEV